MEDKTYFTEDLKIYIGYIFRYFICPYHKSDRIYSKEYFSLRFYDFCGNNSQKAIYDQFYNIKKGISINLY